MLVLLPPSEGKTAPRRGRSLALESLSFPTLLPARAKLLDALVALCAVGTPQGLADAAAALELGPTQTGEVERNARLVEAPTARADQVYSGVLYEALGLGSLHAAARRRANASVAVTSALFGLVRPGDRIPAYRLSGSAKLPGIGPVAQHWSHHLAPAVEEAARGGLVVDLRSGTYVPFWRPDKKEAARVVAVRVLHEVAGRRRVVSHFNKATKGRLVRELLVDGSQPRTVPRFTELLRDLGWTVEPADRPGRLDVVVTDL